LFYKDGETGQRPEEIIMANTENFVTCGHCGDPAVPADEAYTTAVNGEPTVLDAGCLGELDTEDVELGY
jgi:hypothetical protein